MVLPAESESHFNEIVGGVGSSAAAVAPKTPNKKTTVANGVNNANKSKKRIKKAESKLI